jgi:uncharacterized lipoprotein YddW (UPF0748 family)
MKKFYFLFTFFVFIIEVAHAQTAPKREMRGAWIATYANIDWPSSTATSAQEQSTFIDRINEHKATGMNALFVQVRSQCDALYPNPYDPWSAVLSGTQGTAPNPLYDPLAFMINETKQRGMEFHAWFNPYRALASFTTASYNALAASHVAKAHPTWIMTVTNNPPSTTKQLLLNPGAPEVIEHIIGSVMHVVRNYDVDGIHFDDYFYTNPATTTYNDDSVYAIHNRGIADRGDWRRSNVDTLIKRLNDSIKSVKPWIKLGISPSGIWMSYNITTEPNGSNTSTGALQHKKDLFANSRLWLQQGWIDYLAPQVYWYIGQSGSDYNNLAPWWSNNNFGRHIYMGQAGYKVGDAAQNAAFATDKAQIAKQVRLDRTLAGIQGQIVYNTTSLRNNPLGFRDSLRLNLYNRPALLPTMPWKDNVAPGPATSLAGVKLGNNTISLTWVNPPAAVASEFDVVKRFAIYKGVNTMPDINNAADLIAITNTDVYSYIDVDVLPNTTYNYVVTAIDRLHNESVASNMATVVVGALPLTLISFEAEKNSTKNVLLTWQTANEINTDFFEVQKSFQNNSFNKIAIVRANDGSAQFNYSITDYNLIENGQYLYRLKMVDKDGRYTFSDSKKIIINNAAQDLAIHPNPIKTGGRLQLEWAGATGKTFYRILNMEGKILIQNNCTFIGGIASLQLNNIIVPGHYIVQCFTNEKMSSLKIVVQ